MHNAHCTRTALRAPYRRNHPSYQSFNSRLAKTNLLSLSDRRAITALIFIQRSLLSENSPTKVALNNSLYDNVGSSRGNKLFKNIRAYSADNSPLRHAMVLANTYHCVFSLDGTVETNKRNLKAHFSHQLADWKLPSTRTRNKDRERATRKRHESSINYI